jgi:DNA-binding transcriptional LysR family regulator
MKIESLDAFVKIAQLRSFTQAAEACFCTQATISTRLKNLELHFKTRLFDRIGRNIELTEEGRRILPFCQSALNSLEQSKIEIESMNGLTSGRLALCSSNTPGTYLLPEIISGYHHQYLGIEIDSRIRYARDVIQEMLFDGEAELGFVSQPELIDDKKIVCEPILADELGVIVSAQHNNLERWLKRGNITICELQKETLLLSNPQSSLLQNLEKASDSKIKFNNKIVLGSMEAVKKAVCLNTGIAIVSQFLIEDELIDEKLFRFNIKGLTLKRTVYLLHRKNRNLSPAAKAFIKILEKELLLHYPESCLID